MFATQCPNHDELLAYAIGQLPDDTSDQIASHLDGCAECQAAIATLDDADDTFVTALRQTPAGDPVMQESQCEDALARAVSVVAPPSVQARSGERTTFSRVGEELGEYRLLEEIGHGGMGRVYRALQTKLDRVVALKVLPSHRSDDRRAIARFEREMKAIGRLDHPHIVHAYDAREIDGKPVLAMEYVEGLDLSRVLLSLGKVRVADACELIRQAALGLQYAHENGLVHRDIKPSNVMLTPHGAVKLLDLGLARFEHPPTGAEEMTGAGQPMGTADYMAPEQVSDSRAADIRADIYSLGCTLYKLLTGHAPFGGPEGRGTFDKLTAHVNDPAPSILDFEPALSPAVAELIAKMLAKSPDDRPSTPAEVANSLEPYCEGSDLAGLESLARNVEQQRSSIYDRSFDPPQYSGPPPKELPGVKRGRGPSWLWTAITTLVVLAGLGGFAAGVIITIERNGKRTTLEVPDGSKVAIDDQARVGVQLPGSKSPVAMRADNDVEAIQGVWRIVQRSGKSQHRGLVRSLQWKMSRLEFEGNRVRVRGAGELPASYEYQINPTESPRMIDVFVDGDELLGVYELDGDRLKICFDWGGHRDPSKVNVRPQTVWAGLNSDQEMFVLERAGAVVRHPDENAVLGVWRVLSAELKIDTDPTTRYFSSPMGTLAPGRHVVISPGQFIIEAAEKTQPRKPDVVVGLGGPMWTWAQPMARNDVFEYALDGPRRWISFYTEVQPCRGIYRLEGDELTIRLAASDRPSKVDGPVKEGESLLKLKRSEAGDSLPDATTRKKPLAGIEDLLGNTATLSDMAASTIETYDSNRDGKLTADEWQKIEWHPLSKIAPQFPDPDGDGTLSKTELEAVLRNTLENARDIVTRFDSDEDGQLAYWELGSYLLNLQASDAMQGSATAGQSERSGRGHRGKSMLVFVDRLGGITLHVEDDRLYIRKPLNAAAADIQRVITDRSVSTVQIRINSPYSSVFIDELEEVMKEAKVSAYNYQTGNVMIPLAPVRLDFRIAATRHSDDLPGLSDEEIETLKKMRNIPPEKRDEAAADSLAAKYMWLPIDQIAAEELRSGPHNVIIAAFPKKHLLVSRERDSVMLESDTGDRAWNIEVAELSEEPAGVPAISLTLDDAAGQRLTDLTSRHQGRPFAVVINDRVFMAPKIHATIGSRVKITGNFDQRLAEQLVESFNKVAAQNAQ